MRSTDLNQPVTSLYAFSTNAPAFLPETLTPTPLISFLTLYSPSFPHKRNANGARLVHIPETDLIIQTYSQQPESTWNKFGLIVISQTQGPLN